MKRFRFFPVSFAVAGRRVLVIGNGEAALQKLRLLVRTEAVLTLVAAKPAPDLVEFAAAHDVVQIAEITDDAITGAALAFVAMGDAAIDAQFMARLRAAGVPVNVVDRPQLSDFATPSIVDRAPISIAIATDGHAPVLAIRLRGMIEAMLPSSLGRLGELAVRLRERVRERLPNAVVRRRLWADVFEGRAARFALDGDIDGAADLALAMLDGAAAAPPVGKVVFVEAGLADPDLLTLRAHRLLLAADVVVHDRSVADAVIAMARRDVERVRLDETSSAVSGSMLVRLAGEGGLVVRLIAGVPTADGLQNEIAAVRGAGIDAEIVPGVAAPVGATARNPRLAARRAA
jgi:uroporphyrin-III C-methyltransferase/precorrin-2 dehydrogenase/sirohydrochlorin ferrochelatase